MRPEDKRGVSGSGTESSGHDRGRRRRERPGRGREVFEGVRGATCGFRVTLETAGHGMEEGDLPPRGQPRPPPDNVSRRGLSPLMLLASGEQRSRMLLTSLRGAQGPRSSEWSSPKSQQRRNGEIGVRGVLTNSYERLLCVGRRPGDGRYSDRQNGRGVCLPGSLRCCGTGRLERGGGGGGVRRPDFCNLL